MGEPHRLNQVLMNLIGNAMTLTEYGTIRLAVTSLPQISGAPIFRCEGRDTGIGIPTESHRELFERFSQADDSPTRRYGRTGPGLAIVRQLVEIMGGHVGGERRPGGDLMFWFVLPVAQDTPLPETASVPIDLAEVRILLAMDNATDRAVITQMLRQAGAVTETVADGTGALRRLQEASAEGTPFRIALLDRHMAGKPGLRLAASIRADQSIAQPHLLLFSASGAPASDEAQAAGLSGTLSKPIGHDELLQTISRLLAAAGSPTWLTPPSAPTSSRPSRAHILVVEDNSVNREVAGSLLLHLGYGVDVVENGRQAVQAIQTTHYDLVLMDCQMPELDGMEATRLIRQHEAAAAPASDSGASSTPDHPRRKRRLPIVALTAHALSGDQEHCLAAGMDDFLAKPYSHEALQSVLDRWLTPEAPSTERQPMAAQRQPAPQPATPDVATQQPQASIDRQAWEQIAALQQEGRPDVLARVLDLFLRDADKQRTAIATALSTQDAHALFQVAHSLKSKASTLGAVRLAEFAKNLEAHGRGETLPAAQALLPSFEREFDLVCTVFRAELARRRPAG